MRKWSGVTRLNPVPCTNSTRSARRKSSTNCSSDSMPYIAVSIRGNRYSAPLGIVHDTPGIDVSRSWATLRWRASLPPGATSAAML